MTNAFQRLSTHRRQRPADTPGQRRGTGLLCRLLATLAAVTLAGCGSTPPSQYYLLTSELASRPAGQGATASGEDAAPRALPDNLSVGVGPVNIAAYLDRLAIVERRGNRLELHQYHRWAEPLGAGIARVLEENLATAAASEWIVSYPWAQHRQPDLAVQVDMLQFHRDHDTMRLKARWTISDLRTEPGQVVVEKTSALRQPGNAISPGDTASAGSRLLAQLSQHILQALITAAHRSPPPDPATLGPVNTNLIVTVSAKKTPIKARGAQFGHSK